MKKLIGNRGFLAVLIVVALVAGVAIGGAFFARTVSDDGDGTAAADESAASSSTSTTAASDDSPDPGDGTGGAPNGATGPSGDALDASELRVVEPVGGPPPLAYRDDQGGLDNTGTIPPPTAPAEVSLSSTENLRPGDTISIRAVPTAGSQMFGFRARLCKRDAELENLYDFFPVVAPNCIANPLSADSDAYVEVQVQPPYQLAEGSFRVGLGTDSFQLDDGSEASVTCSKAEPCQLVLQVHFPYGFAYYRYDLSFA